MPFAPSGANFGEDELSFLLRRVLHRAVHLFADPRHAGRQAGRGPLRPVTPGLSLRALRQARASCGMRQFATDRRDVREKSG